MQCMATLNPERGRPSRRQKPKAATVACGGTESGPLPLASPPSMPLHARPPRKAFILAAGLGTRLRPLTLETPKPMIPLWGRPMLDRALEMLAAWGVRDVLVNLHHAPGPILNHLARQPFPNLRISCVYEPVILGTGGALRNAAWFLDQPFWLLNADVVADLDPAPILRAVQRDAPLAACWLTEDAGPKTVRCDNGSIANFHDPERGHATFCGLHLLDPRILEFIAPQGFDTIIDAYRRAQARGHRIAGVFVPGSFWADVGTPDQYLQAHRDSAARLGHADRNPTLPAAALLDPRELDLLRRHRLADDSTQLEVLPPRGSSRQFFRIRSPQPAMLVRWSPDRPDNAFYAQHTSFLEYHNVSVPSLLLDAPAEHLLALEDLGDDTLQTLLPGMDSPHRRLAYERLMIHLARLHLDVGPCIRSERIPLMPPFDDDLYAWEHAYFIDHFLRGRLAAPDALVEAVAAELRQIPPILARSPQALIHRDIQSSNVLFRDGRPVLIDYQGMRFGPAAYDLASLLCDPYADLPTAFQNTYLKGYLEQYEGPRAKTDTQAIAEAFPLAAIQRLCQALGAYARLSLNPGMESFARHVPPAIRQLLRAISKAPLPFPALRKAITP
jgi:mannose-1-phosphate guanylyltransferase